MLAQAVSMVGLFAVLKCHATTHWEWSVLSETGKRPAGSTDRPRTRYDHIAGAWQGKLYISHGYMFDHDISTPTLFDDTWEFSPTYNSWRAVQSSPRPALRMSAAAAVVGDCLYMYGGEDGGYAQGTHSHVFGSYHNDVWRLNLPYGPWERVSGYDAATEGPRSGRGSHSATSVGSSLIVFGGHTGLKASSEGADHLFDSPELWEFNTADASWSLLAAEAKMARHGAAIVSSGRKVWLFGGTQLATMREGKLLKPNLNDLWYYDLGAKAGWVQVAQSGHIPHVRAHHGFTSLAAAEHLIVFGGAHCAPGCTCFSDTFLMDLRNSSAEGYVWQELQSGSPASRYRHTMVSTEKMVLMFGGESYKPYMYHNDVHMLTFNHSSLQKPGWLDWIGLGSDL